MQIAYSNTEHLVGSYVTEKQVCVQLARKLLGLTPLPIANPPAQFNFDSWKTSSQHYIAWSMKLAIKLHWQKKSFGKKDLVMIAND